MAHADTFRALSRESQLPPDAARQLTTRGFVVIPGPSVPGGIERVQAAFDSAVAAADVADVRVASSTRVTDFVNRSAEFDGLYIFPPLLAACCLVIGRPFKLSNTCARTLDPGAAAQQLHADVEYKADGWPLVGYIWMIDAFTVENGATRFVSGSHLRHYDPENRDREGASDRDEAVLDASVRHGHTANQSACRRRSVQGHFVARDATAAIDYGSRMRPETLSRIGAVARYLLGLSDAV
jgi:hypothetical protein